MELTSKLTAFAKRLVPPIILDGVRSCSARYRLGSNTYKSENEERKILRLLDSYPPLSPTEVTLRHRRLSVLDGPSFAAIYREQFNQQVYCFEPSSSAPLIVDCGANVGLVSVYFKSVFPDARILAFEPDPACFCALNANCSQLDDVILYQAAVWIESGTVSFSRVGSVGGHLSELAHSDSRFSTITVPAVRLRDFLVEPVEFLKLDIEGSEFDVLADCERSLHYVRRLFVELHSFSGRPQRLSEAISIIERAGFRIHAHGVSQETQPFLRIPSYHGKDFGLNLFCYRPPG
jgi:FkbM family methyltransferase